MIYKKLKDLVEQAVRDGELTAEEERALMARAREMGQDLDEFKSYLENERKDWARYRASQEEARQEKEREKQEKRKRPALYLAERISELESSSFYDTNQEKRREIEKELGKVITPTDQESLFELANFLFSKYSYGKFNDLYKPRLNECINMGLLSFPSDERFKNLETAFKEKQTKEEKTRVIVIVSSLLIAFILIIICAIFQ